jgi:hypothetical protein
VRILRFYGLQEKNYNVVALGQDSQRILALMKNQVQATLLNPDSAAVAETQLDGINDSHIRAMFKKRLSLDSL